MLKEMQGNYAHLALRKRYFQIQKSHSSTNKGTSVQHYHGSVITMITSWYSNLLIQDWEAGVLPTNVCVQIKGTIIFYMHWWISCGKIQPTSVHIFQPVE